MNLAVRDGFESFTPQVFDFGKRCCNDLCQYLDNLSLSNVKLFSDIHEASSEQLRINLCGMLDLVGSEIVRVRDCVNASLSSALGDFSVRFDKLEKLIGDLIRGVPMASGTISPVVVAELVPLALLLWSLSLLFMIIGLRVLLFRKLFALTPLPMRLSIV
jgi:hypothetical protein